MGNDFNVIRELPDGGVEIDEDLLREIYRQIRKDRLFLETHQSEWLDLYPDMFVAVYQEKLVGVASDSAKLAEYLKDKGVPVSRTYWRFLASEPMDLVVPG